MSMLASETERRTSEHEMCFGIDTCNESNLLSACRPRKWTSMKLMGVS